MNPSFPSPDTETAASMWAARLESGSFNAQDRTELDAWLAADPRHRPLLADYCQFSADLETVLPALVAAGRVASPPAGRRAARVRYGWGLAGALVAAALAVAFWLGIPPVAPVVDRVATAATQRQTHLLSDGSQVELNAHTSIEFSVTDRERRLRLASGQAFFRVNEDTAIPFIVETPAGSVRVTGTRFDVRVDTTTSLEVTVEEGSVQVRLGERAAAEQRVTYPLEAGGHLAVRAGGVAVEQLSADDVANLLAWREGRIVFAGTPLNEALARFARYHGRGIAATSETADLRIGGRFSLDDLDGFFAALEEILPVRVTRDLSGTVLVRARPNA